MSRRTLDYRRWHDLAVGFQREVDGIGLGAAPPRIGSCSDKSLLLHLYDETITSPSLRNVSRALFRDRHYARSVEEAFKCLNNAVKDKSGLSSKDGADLMRRAFSANDPILILNGLSSTSERDEQRGYMEIYAGSMMGIRNPRAHDHQLNDHPKTALQLLVLANHLMDKLDVSARFSDTEEAATKQVSRSGLSK